MRYNWLVFVFFILCGCYSFKGISIPEDVNTYYIYDVQSNASEAPIFLTQTFYQAFRDKIRAETKLRFNESSPDVEINASVDSYVITYVAPQPGQNVASNRLTIGLKVEYTDNKVEKRSWVSTFRRFSDYSANANLLDIQDQLINQISEEIMEDFFNKAFGDW
jgi:hypothetical protein